MAKTSEDIARSRLATDILTSDPSESAGSTSSANLKSEKYQIEITESFDRIEQRMNRTIDKLVNDDG